MLGFSFFFWLCSSLFVINQLIEKAGYIIPFVHSYLDDILCPGIVLGFALTIQQQLTYRTTTYRFSLWNVIFFVAWYSILFEVLLPIWDQRHFSDPWDVLAYTSGAFLFLKFGNREGNALWNRQHLNAGNL